VKKNRAFAAKKWFLWREASSMRKLRDLRSISPSSVRNDYSLINLVIER
jgi:hypothetical protein